MNIKMSLICISCLAFILQGCSKSNTPTTFGNGANIVVSDAHNIEIIDNLNQSKIVENNIFLQSISYDNLKKEIVGGGLSPESNFVGLIYFTHNETHKKDTTRPFIPIHIYQYKNLYLMDSAQALKDGNMDATSLGFYDTNTNKIISTIQVPGIVKDITGDGSKAYVTSYLSPGSAKLEGVTQKSNIYEIDMENKIVHPLYKTDQKWVPFKLLAYHGYLYGVFQSAQNVPYEAPQDILVKININNGNIIKEVKLSKYAKDLVLSTDGNSIFVSHFEGLGSKIEIKTPLSCIDLATFKVTEIQDNFRVSCLTTLNGKLYVGDEMNNLLTVIDEKSHKVNNIIKLKIPAIYITNSNF